MAVESAEPRAGLVAPGGPGEGHDVGGGAGLDAGEDLEPIGVHDVDEVPVAARDPDLAPVRGHVHHVGPARNFRPPQDGVVPRVHDGDGGICCLL